MSDFTNKITEIEQEHDIQAESADAERASLEDVDLSVLNSFEEAQSEGEPDLIVELIDLYLADVPKHLSAMKDCVLNDSQNSLSRSAHNLKGSSANLGIKSIALLCKELEQSESGESILKSDIINRLEQTFARVRSLLLAERQKRLQTPAVAIFV